MSIDVVIKQKGLFKKKCPIDVILGNELTYGTYEVGHRLCPEVIGPKGFIAYNKSRVGRGFSVERSKKLFFKSSNPDF